MIMKRAEIKRIKKVSDEEVKRWFDVFSRKNIEK
jgi:hypothetical protein